MKRCVTLQVVGIVLLSALPLVAQTKAKAEGVPETPIELLVGELSHWRVQKLTLTPASAPASARPFRLGAPPLAVALLAQGRPESPASFGMASAQAAASCGEALPKR